ncbi:undecaprenyl/decaprenyl-phosphate alpha-N-acetylglucosaminyl 1-phosphate transferase [Candidatus Woesebacteria bacterium]|nr:undecaprenyl/decaprenyl-phosphate alpha-N-acetylglucosaminyl 1-phosphate transferase [Candidatus Woesebacteria bacterium]
MNAFLITALLATLLTPVVIKWYTRMHWVDDPESATHAKKTHTHPVPRGGGLIIFTSVLVSSLIFLSFDSYLVHILAAAALLTLVGFLDDIYDIHPLIRLFTGLFAALLVVGSGIGIAYISNPFGPGVIHLDQPQLTITFLGQVRHIWVIADIFAVLFILWNMNIVNWSKGVDGQMPGFVSIALVMVGLLSTRFHDDPTQFNTMILSFIVAGSYAGLLVWNWYPQKIMPGYGAGSLAGFFLSVLAILSGAKIATIVMVLAIPTADAIFTIVRRLYAGKSPLWGDRGHLHHKLLDVFHWGRRRIAVFYWLSSAVLGILSLYLNTTGKLVTIAIIFLMIFGVLIVAKMQSTTKRDT